MATHLEFTKLTSCDLMRQWLNSVALKAKHFIWHKTGCCLSAARRGHRTQAWTGQNIEMSPKEIPQNGAQLHLLGRQHPEPHSQDNGLALKQIPEYPQVAHSKPRLEAIWTSVGRAEDQSLRFFESVGQLGGAKFYAATLKEKKKLFSVMEDELCHVVAEMYRRRLTTL